MTNQYGNRWMLPPEWVQSIRDRDFLLTWADVPHEYHNEFDRIHEDLRQDAWELTQIIFPYSTKSDHWVEIENETMCVLSEYWWSLVNKRLAEGGLK